MTKSQYEVKTPGLLSVLSFATVLRPWQCRISLLWALAQSIFLSGYSQKEVPQQVMQQIYDEVKTPYKYGLVITPENDSKKIDCPSVFRKGKDWYMTYILFDGRGYETWLAKSKNLLDWKTLGRLMSFGDTTDKDNDGMGCQPKSRLYCFAGYQVGRIL